MRPSEVALWLGACVLLLAVTAIGTLLYMERRIEANLDRFDAFSGLTDRPVRPPGVAPSALNVLLIGTDEQPSGAPGSAAPDSGTAAPAPELDALMLVHVDADRQGISVISLPREAVVPVPSIGPARIATTFAEGGVPLTVASVEQLSDVRVDHVAVVDWEGLSELTDMVGPVEVTVPRASHDPERDVTWSAGRHALSGAEALAFLRQREGLRAGDLERAQRQQVFLRALFDRTARDALDGGPLKTYRVVQGVSRHLAVDDGWSTRAMGRLAFSLRGLREDDVDLLTVPVSASAAGGDAVRLDTEPARALWDAVRTDDLDSWTARPRGGDGDAAP